MGCSHVRTWPASQQKRVAASRDDADCNNIIRQWKGVLHLPGPLKSPNATDPLQAHPNANAVFVTTETTTPAFYAGHDKHRMGMLGNTSTNRVAFP
eukprot:1136484-Pelagomonas_calceolata.AAC.5